MAYFHHVPMPPVPPGATQEQRQAMFDAYVSQVRQENPQLNTGAGWLGWLCRLIRGAA
jgi:hypothetical protein